MGYGEEERKDIDWDDSPLRRKVNPTMSLSMGKIILLEKLISLGSVYEGPSLLFLPSTHREGICTQALRDTWCVFE